MSLQTAFGAVLLIGLPVMLLAVGVLAHAYYVARPRNAARTDRMIEDLIAESMDQLIAELRATSSRVEGSPPSALPPLPPLPALTPLAAARPSTAPITPALTHTFSALGPAPARAAQQPMASTLAPLNLRGAVSQLLAEGLSDRSIARRLGVGIEEVRAARVGHASRRAA